MTDADQDKPSGETPDADHQSPAGEPATPVSTETPADLEASSTPETPAEPAELEPPAAPATPAEPEAVASPATSAPPEAPSAPATPEASPVPPLPLSEPPSQAATASPTAEPSAPAPNRAFLFAAAAIGIGAVAGTIIGAVSLQQMRATPAPAPVAVEHPGLPREVLDLGTAQSSDTGLKGHLTAQWTEKPVYNVTIEPADAAQSEGFALSVSNPPHPLSIRIQLTDRLGFVACSTDVLLKYPVKMPADLDPRNPKSASAKKPALKKISDKQAAHLKAEQAEFDQKQAEQTQRELGKDVFQNQVGKDGQIVSISAKGTVPCTMESYERVAAWGFVPDFPTLDEQADLISLQPKAVQAAARIAAERTRRRMVFNPPSKPLSFSFEGDDAVVDFDVPGGVLETKAGKTFVIDKTGSQANSAIWQEYPAYFHYRCDQSTSSCTLARAGAGVMHGKLKR
jgi:hypothetical protein